MQKNILGGVFFLALIIYFWPQKDEATKVELQAKAESRKNLEEGLPEEKPEDEKAAAKVVQKLNDKPAKVEVKPEVEVVPQPMPTAAQQPANNNQYTPPPLGYVQFQVIDGWAVAFGDVLLGKLKGEWKPGQTGNYQPKESQLWPNSEIPYYVHVSGTLKAEVEKAIEEFNSQTNIVFVPYNGQKDYIVFTEGKENCLSYLGKIGGQQPIYLSPKCGKNEITHEIMHALGFVHEQSRSDREKFVEVHFQNIKKEFHAQYDVIPSHLVDYYNGSDFLFDYNSVMMYSDSAFALQPDLKTMSSRTSEVIEPSRGLSKSDISRVNRLYGN